MASTLWHCCIADRVCSTMDFSANLIRIFPGRRFEPTRACTMAMVLVMMSCLHSLSNIFPPDEFIFFNIFICSCSQNRFIMDRPYAISWPFHDGIFFGEDFSFFNILPGNETFSKAFGCLLLSFENIFLGSAQCCFCNPNASAHFFKFCWFQGEKSIGSRVISREAEMFLDHARA